MKKESVDSSILGLIAAVIIFCYFYFFGFSSGDLILSVIVSLFIIGLSDILYKIFVILIYLIIIIMKKIRFDI